MFKFLCININFFYFAIASLIMQIGIGLTQVAVYGHLARIDASPLYFTLAFSLATIPGLFSSQIGSYLSKKVNIIFLCVAIQLLGAFSLFLPILGINNNQIILLLFAEFISAFIAGFIYPISQIYIKRVFTDKNYLPLASKLDVYLFSINIIIGTFIGTLLYAYFNTENYLLINSLAYVISSFIYVIAYFTKKNISIKNLIITENFSFNKNNRFLNRRILFLKNFSIEQKYPFLILIYLPIATTPSISLLPTIGNKYGSNILILGINLTPALLFILAKTIGQIIGPMLIKNYMFEKFYNNKSVFIKCNFLFLLMYLVIYFIDNIYISIILIISAHIFSNIVFSLGMFATQRTFKIDEISDVSAKQYQISTFSMAIISLMSGFLVKYIPYYVLIFIPFIIIYLLLFFQENTAKSLILNKRKNSIDKVD
ncbi:MFS transporter [Fluviispira sanaruensis]|uniref:MFS transporter n=1 Tax=Fluviispira sanaruensis TaxID=2493639 RepID=A0A4P2VKM1_FLUSA|nr:MFS transporter [Fluviispira sanaruensis]BBH52444.1 hypothetical protein JCM31447_08850 [Fluviispira sanaruensis]